MAKTENQKVKTLFVAKYFLENSDENHPVTAGDIVDYLKSSDQFYSWVCGFRKEAVILSPPDVVEEMEKFLKDIVSCYQVAGR